MEFDISTCLGISQRHRRPRMGLSEFSDWSRTIGLFVPHRTTIKNTQTRILHRSSRTVVALMAFLVMFCASAAAEVSLKNGNFFIGFTDLSYPGGFEPKIERVYNSKSSFKGIFGEGWGSEFEVYLTIEGDGTVVAHEYGGGANNSFSPPSLSESALTRLADTILKGAISLDPNLNGLTPQEYKAKLIGDALFRDHEWDKLVAAKLVHRRELPVGTRLVSLQFSYQFIETVPSGYRRTFDNGRIEIFNSDGKLTRVEDKNANWITLEYDSGGHLNRIVDNFGRSIRLTLSEQGLVESVEDIHGNKFRYRYNDRSELVYLRGLDGKSIAYQYDSLGRHNLVAVAYEDGSTMAITYYPESQFENVWAVKDRDDTVSTYHYGTQQDDSYQVSVETRDGKSKTVSTSNYEYFERAKPDGERWTYRLIAVVDGNRTDTIYDELSGLPTSITSDNGKTSFEYDARGHVTLKDSHDEIAHLKYDDSVGKVSFVQVCSKPNTNECKESRFYYDERGNLTHAESNEPGVRNLRVDLTYDGNGRIATLRSGTQTVTFDYDINSKPKKISVLGLGAITVYYSSQGEVERTESTGGRKVALQVTTLFQRLLDVIRPAGVSLSQ